MTREAYLVQIGERWEHQFKSTAFKTMFYVASGIWAIVVVHFFFMMATLPSETTVVGELYDPTKHEPVPEGTFDARWEEAAYYYGLNPYVTSGKNAMSFDEFDDYWNKEKDAPF